MPPEQRPFHDRHVRVVTDVIVPPGQNDVRDPVSSVGPAKILPRLAPHSRSHKNLWAHIESNVKVFCPSLPFEANESSNVGTVDIFKCISFTLDGMNDGELTLVGLIAWCPRQLQLVNRDQFSLQSKLDASSRDLS